MAAGRKAPAPASRTAKRGNLTVDTEHGAINIPVSKGVQDWTKFDEPVPRHVGGGQAENYSGERIIGMYTSNGKLAGTSNSATPHAIGQATKHRNEWEGTKRGQKRMETVTPETHGMTSAQYHFERNYGKETVGPQTYDRQLPGMSNPDAAPRPARWEELHQSQRDATDRSLAAHGTSRAQMRSDFAAQRDQAALRADELGASHAHAEKFYSPDSPQRKVLDTSAKSLGVPNIVHAQMNAFTSPQTKFQVGDRFPNDEAASHAVRHAQQGGTPETYNNQLSTTGTEPAGSERKAQGFETNARKAITSMNQYQEGVRPADWKTGTKGESPWKNAPKTGPYANSWNDSHPQFFVSDIHSGGGGMLPHLGTEKTAQYHEDGSYKLDKKGEIKRDKSGREKAIAKIPNFHSAADVSARQAVSQRGGGSLREAQGMQWGEEQIQRGARGGIRESEAYTSSPAYAEKLPTRSADSGQMSMFTSEKSTHLNVDAMPAAKSADTRSQRRSDTAEKLGLEF